MLNTKWFCKVLTLLVKVMDLSYANFWWIFSCQFNKISFSIYVHFYTFLLLQGRDQGTEGGISSPKLSLLLLTDYFPLWNGREKRRFCFNRNLICPCPPWEFDLNFKHFSLATALSYLVHGNRCSSHDLPINFI